MNVYTRVALFALLLAACGDPAISKAPVVVEVDENAQNNTAQNNGSSTNNAANTNAQTNNVDPNAVCGNGIVEGGETCDGVASTTCEDLGFDGGTVSCNDCQIDSTACTRASCGDGVIQAEEFCDDGAQNGTYDQCSANCSQIGAYCGDDTVNGPEECDGGDLGSTTCADLGFDGGDLGCSDSCGYDTSGCSSCGNGVVEDGETCDDGGANGTYGSCNTTCDGLAAHCGDGVVNGNEECDGAQLGGETCSTTGLGRGNLACNTACEFDAGSCSQAPAQGEVVITEIMQNPDASYDNDGEWFELYNRATRSVDLAGCTIESSTSNGPEFFDVEDVFVMGPFGYGVMARSSNAPFVADYIYGGAINLNNASDYLELRCPDPFGGPDVVVDRVEYDDGATFPDPTGASMILSPVKLDPTVNDYGYNWCESTSTFGIGDLGTPGAANDSC